MRRSLPLFLASLTLLACTAQPSAPATTTSSDPARHLLVTLRKEQTTDSLATVRTRVFMQVEGGTEERALLFDGAGDMLLVDTRALSSPQPLLSFTTWWAGAGDDVRVWLRNNPPALVVEERSGDEGGACTPWKEKFSIPVAKDAKINLVGTDAFESAEQSALAWCD